MPQINSEGGEHVVKTGESWFSIARSQLGGEATASQVAAYAQEIARVNGGLTILRSNRTIRLPQTVVGEKARPTTEFMAAARGELSDYRAGTFDPTGVTQASAQPTNAPTEARKNGQSLYPSYTNRQTQGLSQIAATPTGFGGQLVGGRYAEAGTSKAPPAYTPREREQSGLSAPNQEQAFNEAMSRSRNDTLTNLVTRTANQTGRAVDTALQAIGASLSNMFPKKEAAQQQPQTTRQMSGANMTQEQQRGLQIAAQQNGGNLPSPQTQLAELSYAMAQGSLPPAIYATVAYSAGLRPEALIARGYEFTNTGYWVYAQDDIQSDALPEASELFNSSPMGASYGIDSGYYGAPFGLEETSYGGGDVNGGYSRGAYSNPYSGRVGSSNISWRIGIS